MWTINIIVLLFSVFVNSVRVPTNWNNVKYSNLPQHDGTTTFKLINHPRRMVNDNIQSGTQYHHQVPEELVLYRVSPPSLSSSTPQSQFNGVTYPNIPHRIPIINPRYTQKYLATGQMVIDGRAQQPYKNFDSVNVPSSQQKFYNIYKQYPVNMPQSQYPPIPTKFIVKAQNVEELEKITLPNIDASQSPTLVTQGYTKVLVQGNKNNKKSSEVPKKALTKKRKVIIKSGNELFKETIKKPNTNKSPKLIKLHLKPYLEKNYRDDRTYEPDINFDEEKITDENERIPDEPTNFDDDDEEEEEEETDDDDEKEKLENEESDDGEVATTTNNADEEEEAKSTEENEETEEEEEKIPAKEIPDEEHSEPKIIPTKPIYPGEGLWAKKGLKHRPHITQHRFLNADQEEIAKKPDGYDVFEKLEEFFKNHKTKIDNQLQNQQQEQQQSAPLIKINKPKTSHLPVVYDPFSEAGSTQSSIKIAYAPSSVAVEENDEAEAEEDFVPTRLYTQVRNTDNVKHIPHNPAEHGRLKEVIEDKKVQTVYSEEGYEDSAYDHAGHEKKAEEEQELDAFEKYKQKKAARKLLKDSEGGHSHLVPAKDSLPADSKHSPKIVEDFHKKNASNNFISTKELKTTQVKDNDNGNIELEIESEVKYVLQPNSSAKAHKFVKIYPKVLKELKSNDEDLNENEDEDEENEDEDANESNAEVNSTEVYIKANNSITDESVKIESTTAPIIEVLTESVEAEKNKTLLRKRRESSETPYEDVKVDIGFIDKIKHNFAPSTTERPLDKKKYPYYNNPNVDPDSPIHYAENLKTIPTKHGDKLSFYESRENIECPDLPQEINPVPKKVNKAHKEGEHPDDTGEEYDEDEEEEDETEDEGSAKKPRLQIGDKIDCYKIKYFGENPLDSPFFKEETVKPVRPLFKDLENRYKNAAKDVLTKSSEISAQISRSDEIFNKRIRDGAAKYEEIERQLNQTREKTSTTSVKPPKKVNKEHKLEKAETAHGKRNVKISPQIIKSTTTPSNSVVTLITTPKYTIQLTPNNIYDQIKLLDHLPQSEEDDSVDEVPAGVRRRAKEVTFADESIAESEALRRLRPNTIRRPPYLQIFDVNHYLPNTTPFPSSSIIDTASTTVLPKHLVHSEVYYKEEIKPSEQLNVFADVFNNIKNSSKYELPSISKFAEPNSASSTISPIIHKHRVKKFQVDSSNHSQNQLIETITQHPFGSKIPPKENSKDKPSSSLNTVTNRNKIRIKKIRRRIRKPPISSTTTSTTTQKTTTNIQMSDQITPSNHQPYIIDFIEDDSGIIGLVPPSKSHQYKTIVVPIKKPDTKKIAVIPEMKVSLSTVPSTYSEIPVTEIQDEISPTHPMNQYFVVGMKPPFNNAVRLYSDYIIDNTISSTGGTKRKGFRAKRSASRPTYAEVSRNRGSQSINTESPINTSKEDTVVDDDYVPHRPKNYHYDEKTGKIIYHNKPKEAEEEEIEEYEEVVVTEAPGIYLERAAGATHPTPQKVTTKELLATATPPPEGKGLLDFVVKLKNNKNYKYIPDPTTSKPGATITTASSSTLLSNKSTSPPEFLDILRKVKSDKNYKSIEDPKESQSKTKIVTTALPNKKTHNEEYVDEEEEEEIEQTSPSGTFANNYQIFNIGAYLPKIKTITPKTTIDYSKYKTIERPRHNISSKYKLEDNDEEIVSKPPIEAEAASKIEQSRLSSRKSAVTERNVAHASATQRIGLLKKSSVETDETSTEKAAPTSTTTRKPFNRRKPLPSGFRRDSKPSSSSTSTEAVVATKSTENIEKVQNATNNKLKRVYRRRPIRIRHTTERQEENLDDVEKIVRRSLADELTTVPKEFFIEYLEEPNVEATYEEIKSEILPEDLSDDVHLSDGETSASKKAFVKEKPEKSSVELTEEITKEITTEIPDVENIRTENPKNEVAILDENYNKTEKHGGNYYHHQAEEETTIKAEETQINLNKTAETLSSLSAPKTDDEEKEVEANTEVPEEEEEEEEEETDFEIDDDDYEDDEADNEEEEGIEESENDPFEEIEDEPSEVKEEPVVEEDPRIPVGKTDVEVTEEISTEQSITEENEEAKNTELPLVSDNDEVTTQISHVSDIIETKMEPDAKLENQINKQQSQKVPVTLINNNSDEQLDQIAQEGDVVEERKIPQARSSINNNNRRNFENERDIEEITTEKPIYEKDPSKRLYYYVKV